MHSLSFRFIDRRLIVTLSLFIALLFSSAGISTAQDKKITWYSMQEAQQKAKMNGKKVLIFAEASWCMYCKKMLEEVFPKPAVVDSMTTYFYPVRVDIESDKQMIYNGKKITQRKFAQNSDMQATPTYFFLDEDGKKLGAQPGFIPAETFSRLLGFVGSGAFQQMEFKTYLKRYVSSSDNQK